MQATILPVDQSAQSAWKRRPQGAMDPDNLELAFSTSSGREIRYYDDGMGPLWIYRNTHGIVGIVRAQDEWAAMEIVDDEFLPVVPVEEVPEAYGQWDAFAAWCRAHYPASPEFSCPSKAWSHCCDFVREYLPVWWKIRSKEWQETGDWPELVEGYRHQSNATGSGIVSYDLNGESLELLTLELAERLELQITVRL